MTAFWWALVTAVIWGIVPVMEKVGLGPSHISPSVGVVARSLGVVAGLLLFGWAWGPWSALRTIGWPSLALLAGGGFLASFLGQCAFYQALKGGGVSQVTPVAGTYPLVAALLGWSLLREPLTATRALGVALVIAGIILLRR